MKSFYTSSFYIVAVTIMCCGGYSGTAYGFLPCPTSNQRYHQTRTISLPASNTVSSTNAVSNNIAADGKDSDSTSSTASSLSLSSLEITPTAKPYLSTTRVYERLADEILDIILLDPSDITEQNLSKKQQQQLLEFQSRLVEHLSKLMTVNGKTLWSQARMKSGILPNGRTVLGTLIDPWGLFLVRDEQPRRRRYSRTSSSYSRKPTSNEERSILWTRQLLELVLEYNDRTGKSSMTISSEVPRYQLLLPDETLSHLSSSSSEPSTSAMLMKRSQLSIFSRILSGRIWDRRIALIGASNRFWKQTLQIQASKSSKQIAKTTGKQIIQNLPVLPQPHEQKEETERLQTARQFLEYYQSADAEERSLNSVKTTL